MPTEEEIKKLAYSIWEHEGRPSGEDIKHYFTAKRILEAQERRTAMSPKKMLIVDDSLIEKIDQNRGDVSRVEFLEFCLDKCLEELQSERAPGEERGAAERESVETITGEHAYLTRSEFQEFKRSVRELLRVTLDFLITFSLGTRASGATEDDLERLKRRLDTIAGEQ